MEVSTPSQSLRRQKWHYITGSIVLALGYTLSLTIVGWFMR